MKLHPDQNPDDEKVAEQFKEVSAAYALLSDEKMRARYDRGEINPDGSEKGFANYQQHAGAGGGNPFGGGGFSPFGQGFDAEDLFSSLFGGARNTRGRGPMKKKGEDKTYRLNIDFLDAVRGSTQKLKLQSGKALNVKTPENVKEGQQIRLKGQGLPGIAGGPNGDALIEVHIKMHAFFKQKDDNILMDLPITLDEAVLGAKITVPTITGKIALTIPKNSNSGKVMRLKGKGATNPKTKAKGDQLVKLMIMLPSEGNKEIETAVTKWAKKNGDSEKTKIRSHLA